MNCKPPKSTIDNHSKRGKSLSHNSMKSNGFSRSAINNSTSYQSNFNDAAQSTSTSKHFNQSPMTGAEHKKPNQRSESLVARSMTYSHCT